MEGEVINLCSLSPRHRSPRDRTPCLSLLHLHVLLRKQAEQALKRCSDLFFSAPAQQDRTILSSHRDEMGIPALWSPAGLGAEETPLASAQHISED